MPEGISPDNMPFYGGKVLISGSNGEELSVPYMGPCFPLCIASPSRASEANRSSGAAFDIKKEFDTVYELNYPTQTAGENRDDIDIHHAQVPP